MDDEERDDKISEAITPIITELLNKVTFDPNTEEVVFIQEPHHIEYLRPQDLQYFGGNPYLLQVLPDVEVEIAPEWINSPIFRNIRGRNPITNLIVENHRGINEDDRSHRGDELPEDFVAPEAPPEEDANEEDEDEDEEHKARYRVQRNRAQFVHDLDYRNFKYDWTVQNGAGITWGNLLEGIMWTKGSKFDKNYEMFANAYVTFPAANLMKVELDFDHGS